MVQLTSSFGDNFTQLLDFDGGALVIYIGYALPGSSEAAAVWQIRKCAYTDTNLTSIKFASGNNVFNKVWSNRASYTYS